MAQLTPDETLLGLLAANTQHGYQLLDCFRDPSQLGEVWNLSTSQLYAVLKRLAAQGLVAGKEIGSTDAPTRTEYQLTKAGRAHLQAWLHEEHPSASIRSVPVEFLSRLYIARQLNIPTMPIVQHQKAACCQKRAELVEQRELIGSGIGFLALELVIAQLDAVLQWIDRPELILKDTEESLKPRLIASILLSLAVLSFSLWPVAAQDAQTLTIFAAASLTDAFTEMGEAFKAKHPGVEIVFNFGSSSALAAQLVEGGAPADVFASANNTQMNVARDGGRIGGSPTTFVKNRLVLIVPADNPANIQSLRDLGNEGVKLVVAAEEVPVREYTDAMLERLAADPSYGEDYRTAVLNNIVSEEENVRQVSAKVALGEADAGVVYRSDVTPDITDQVIALPIPDHLNTLASYPIAITNDSANPDLAQEFIDYVVSDAGQDTLVKWNFISARIPDLASSITLADDGKLHVDGQVLNPLALTADELRNNYAPHTVDVTYRSGEDTVSTTFTGALLWDILSTAQANLNADVRNDKLSTFILATGSDGYQAVIAWGEIDPEFGNQPILVAYEEKGAPIPEEAGGAIRLVVPGDGRGGRYVSWLVNLDLRDAPKVEQ